LLLVFELGAGALNRTEVERWLALANRILARTISPEDARLALAEAGNSDRAGENARPAARDREDA
jgi:hypothetical protein